MSQYIAFFRNRKLSGMLDLDRLLSLGTILPLAWNNRFSCFNFTEQERRRNGRGDTKGSGGSVALDSRKKMDNPFSSSSAPPPSSPNSSLPSTATAQIQVPSAYHPGLSRPDPVAPSSGAKGGRCSLVRVTVASALDSATSPMTRARALVRVCQVHVSAALLIMTSFRG
jgi:hypothetical protein